MYRLAVQSCSRSIYVSVPKKTDNTKEKNPEAKVKNRKNKIMFFNTWFILLFSRIISI